MTGAQSTFAAIRHARLKTYRRVVMELFAALALPRNTLPSGAIKPGLLARKDVAQYDRCVADTEAIRIGVWKMKTADDRLLAVFFRPRVNAHLQWSGLDGGAFGHTGFRFRRYANLVMCPATPIGVGNRVCYPENGGRAMRPASPLAHTGQNFPLIQSIVRDALRAAAFEATPNGDIDVLSDALQHLAELSRAEVRHV